MKKLFLSSAFNQVTDKLYLILPNPKGLKVAFIPTASEPYNPAPWMDKDFAALEKLGFEVTKYDIKGKNEKQIYDDLVKFDVIFASGGNGLYLLYHARESGYDKVVTKLIDEGKL